MNTRPEPVVVQQVCSLCGEDWNLHGDEPTTLDCIGLLKAKAAARVVYAPQPYPVYPDVHPYWRWTQSGYVVTCGSDSTTGTYTAATLQASNTNIALGGVSWRKPDEGEPPEPVAA